MAYKFSLGKYKHSGSLVSAESLTVTTGSVDLPSGTIQTHELQDSAVTNAKIAAGAVQSGSIAAGSIVNGHIVDGTIANAKLVNTGSVLGSTAVVLGSSVSTIEGLAALSASAISGGVVIGDGAGMTNLSASQLNNFTADVRRQVGASGSGGLQYDLAAGLFSLSSSVAGQGLGYSSGVLSIAGDGALKVVTDGAYVSASIAGQGLGFTSGTAADSVAVLNVQTTGVVEVFNDYVRLKSSLAGTGLGQISDPSGGLTSLTVNYGNGAGQAVQGNTAWTASAGNGLTGDASGTLGSPVNFTFAVGAGNGIAVALDQVAVKLSGTANALSLTGDGLAVKLSSSDALAITNDGLDLKQTISGNRVFSNDITVNGNFYVNGGTFSASVGTLLVEDSNIVIADGATVLADGQGFTIGASGSGLATFQVGSGSSAQSAFVSSLELKASKFIGAVEGTVAEGIQLASGTATANKSIVLCDAASAGFTLTLPAASSWTGQFIKVKKSDGTDNAVVVQPAAGTIDGVSSISLDSPRSAVMVVSDGSNWFIF